MKFNSFIQAVDLRMMKALWEPTIRAALAPNARDGPKHNRRNRASSRNEDGGGISEQAKIAIAILKELPHLLHMMFLCAPDERFYVPLWAAANPQHLTIKSEDLAMKYGASIDGVWSVVGIVDAMPMDEPTTPWAVSDLLDNVMTALTAMRQQIGRPLNHVGLTPIAIYMPLRGIAETIASDQANEGL